MPWKLSNDTESASGDSIKCSPNTSLSESVNASSSESTPNTSLSESTISIQSPSLSDIPVGDSSIEDVLPDQSPPRSFTDEQIAQFECRIENDYDIFIDEDFVAWLRLYHPHYLPSDLVTTSTDNPLPIDDQSSGELMDDRNEPEPTPTVSPSSGPPLSQTLASARMTLSSVAEFLTLPPLLLQNLSHLVVLEF